MTTTVCPLATLEQPYPMSPGSAVHDPSITPGKAALIVAGCAVGGFIGGIGLAALATTIIGRRLWERHN